MSDISELPHELIIHVFLLNTDTFSDSIYTAILLVVTVFSHTYVFCPAIFLNGLWEWCNIWTLIGTVKLQIIINYMIYYCKKATNE